MKDQNMSPAVLQSSNSTSLMKTSFMASGSTQPVGATKKLTLKLVMTLDSHEIGSNMSSRQVSSISYFPDGKGMVSTSLNNNIIRKWDLRTGKEIEEAQDVCGREVQNWEWVAVPRDGQWVVSVTSSGNTVGNTGKLQARNVETRIVKTFEGHFKWISRIDISADSMLLVGTTLDGVRMWSMETGKLVAGPFQARSDPAGFGAVRFSQDSKKLAVLSSTGRRLEVWDVQTHKLDVTVGESRYGTLTRTPIFWTTKDKSIVAVFDFKDWTQARRSSDLTDWPGDIDHSEFEGFRRPGDLNTIYEFDALTLEIVGAPFEGHTLTDKCGQNLVSF
jgi:hypothetical protein